MKKSYYLQTSLIILFILLMPMFSFAAEPEPNPLPGGVIPCTDNCGFNDMITLVKNIITFVLYIAVPIAIGMFTYAGVLYLTAGGSAGQIREAHTIFLNVLIGFILVLSAWLIVNTIANALLDTTKFDTLLTKPTK